MSKNNQMLYELEEQLKLCKQDLEEKDQMILELTSMNVKSSLKKPSTSPKRTTNVSSSRSQVDDLAGLQARVGGLCSKTLTQDGEIKALSVILNDMKKEKIHLVEQNANLRMESNKKENLVEEMRHRSQTAEAKERTARERLEQAGEDVKSATRRATEQQRRIEQLIIEKEKLNDACRSSSVKYKALVDWINVLVYSANTVCLDEGFPHDEKDVEAIKSKLSTVIATSKENEMRLDQMRDLVASRDRQVEELRKTASRLEKDLQRIREADHETENAKMALDNIRTREKATHTRVEMLEDQLQDARMQLIKLEERTAQNQSGFHRNEAEASKKFRRYLADLFNQSGWNCSETEDGLSDVTRRVLASLNSKSETCVRLESKGNGLNARINDLERRLADANRHADQVQSENSTLHERLSKTTTKPAGWKPCSCEEGDKLRKFFHKLACRLPMDSSIFSDLESCEMEDYLLEQVGKLVTSSARSSCDGNDSNSTRLQKCIQRLQDQLAASEIQLHMWRQKSTRLEEEIVVAKKNEVDAIQRISMAESRVCKAARVENEISKLKEENIHLITELKNASDLQICLEEKVATTMQLEDTIQGLEGIRQRQANKIADLMASAEAHQSAAQRKLQQQAETQQLQLSGEIEGTYRLLENLRNEIADLRDFQNVVARLVGIRLGDMPAPEPKEILRRLEKTLKSGSGRSKSPQRQISARSVIYSSKNVSPRKVNCVSAHTRAYHAVSDTEPIINARRLHKADMRHTSSSYRLQSPEKASSPETPKQRCNSTGTSSPRDDRIY